MASLADLEFRLSGGASNTDPDASIGGVRSTERVQAQSASGISNVTGVTIDYAAGNALGNGTFAYTQSTSIISWTPNGGSAGTVDISAGNGKYAVQSGNGYLAFTVVAASLPGSDQADTITIANIANEIFDDIAKSESFNGDIEYRCIYVYWNHATDDVFGVKAYIASQPSGADTLAIGLDPAGVGNGTSTGVADTPADESTAPSGVTFSAPANAASGLSIGDLSPGEGIGLWIRRTIAAATVTAAPNDLSQLGFQINV